MDIYKGTEELTTPVSDRQLGRKVTGLGKKPYMKNNSRKKTFKYGEPKNIYMQSRNSATSPYTFVMVRHLVVTSGLDPRSRDCESNALTT